MKPTQIKCSEGSINQLPPWTEIQGDIRVTPFYDIKDCLEKVEGYIRDISNGKALALSLGSTQLLVVSCKK